MRVKDISRLRPVAPSMLAAGQTEDGFCQAFLRAERADEFAKAVPDQAQWVTRFAKHFGVAHVQEVMTRVGYDGPGELFSMYLCLFLVRPPVERHAPSHGFRAGARGRLAEPSAVPGGRVLASLTVPQRSRARNSTSTN